MEQTTPTSEPGTTVQPDRSLHITILAAALIIGGALVYNANSVPGLPNEPLGNTSSTQNGPTVKVSDLLERDVVLGETSAPITLIEYGDYQCPFCARFFLQSEASIRENYVKTGKVKMIYRDFAFLGPESVEAAEAAECAKDQGKFWAYHDALYTAEAKDNVEHNGNLNRELFMKIASELKMETEKFAKCYDSNQYAANVVKTREQGSAVGVSGTPATFVNGTEVQGGAQPYTTYQALFETYLQAN